MRIFKPAFGILAAALMLTLSACDPNSGLAFNTLGFNSGAYYRLNRVTYSATDVLLKQAETKLPTTVPLLVGTISDVNKLETTSALGRTISEQVSARLVQRGYTVSDVRFRNAINVKQDSRVKNADGEYFLSRDTSVLKGEQEIGAAVTGTYTVAKDEVMVNLRIIEASNSHVISSIDYRIPLTDDIRVMVDDDKDAFFKPGPYARDWNF